MKPEPQIGEQWRYDEGNKGQVMAQTTPFDTDSLKYWVLDINRGEYVTLRRCELDYPLFDKDGQPYDWSSYPHSCYPEHVIWDLNEAMRCGFVVEQRRIKGKAWKPYSGKAGEWSNNICYRITANKVADIPTPEPTTEKPVARLLRTRDDYAGITQLREKATGDLFAFNFSKDVARANDGSRAPFRLSYAQLTSLFTEPDGTELFTGARIKYEPDVPEDGECDQEDELSCSSRPR